MEAEVSFPLFYTGVLANPTFQVISLGTAGSASSSRRDAFKHQQLHFILLQLPCISLTSLTFNLTARTSKKPKTVQGILIKSYLYSQHGLWRQQRSKNRP